MLLYVCICKYFHEKHVLKTVLQKTQDYAVYQVDQMEFEKNKNAFFPSPTAYRQTRVFFFHIKRVSSVCVDEFVCIA